MITKERGKIIINENLRDTVTGMNNFNLEKIPTISDSDKTYAPLPSPTVNSSPLLVKF